MKRRPYDSYGSRTGGNLDEYPGWEKQLRSVLFPEYKRRVQVRFSTWVGYDSGARHYYVYFDMESDPILDWDEERQSYQEVETWDFPKEHRSTKYEWTDFIDYNDDDVYEKTKDKFICPVFTKNFADSVIAEHFPSDKFDVEIKDLDMLDHE